MNKSKTPDTAKMIDFVERRGNEMNDRIQQANFREFIDLLTLVEKLMYKEKCILYGGLAIDTWMPSSKKIYTSNTIPDIDSYHHDAKDVAVRTARHLHMLGYDFVVIKRGLTNKKTYRIFADTMQVADITTVSMETYQKFLKTSFNTGTRYIIAKEYLRFSLHDEFSKPSSSPHRWKKLIERYLLTMEQLKFRPGPTDVLTKLVAHPPSQYASIMDLFKKKYNHIQLGVAPYLGMLPRAWAHHMGIAQFMVIRPKDFASELRAFVKKHSGGQKTIVKTVYNNVSFGMCNILFYHIVDVNDQLKRKSNTKTVSKHFTIGGETTPSSEVLCSACDVSQWCVSYVKFNREQFTVIDFLMSILNYFLLDSSFSDSMEFRNECKTMLVSLQDKLSSFTLTQHKRYRFNLHCIGYERTLREKYRDWLNGNINVFEPRRNNKVFNTV
jgi:hypothetical protein